MGLGQLAMWVYEGGRGVRFHHTRCGAVALSPTQPYQNWGLPRPHCGTSAALRPPRRTRRWCRSVLLSQPPWDGCSCASPALARRLRVAPQHVSRPTVAVACRGMKKVGLKSRVYVECSAQLGAAHHPYRGGSSEHPFTWKPTTAVAARRNTTTLPTARFNDPTRNPDVLSRFAPFVQRAAVMVILWWLWVRRLRPWRARRRPRARVRASTWGPVGRVRRVDGADTSPLPPTPERFTRARHRLSTRHQ